MTWATFAHVANDWLAVPLAGWLLSRLMRYQRQPTLRAALLLALVLSAGLLTKAYFLALLPIVLVTCLVVNRWRPFALLTAAVLLLAGPWYARNMTRYGVLSGTQEARAGISELAVLQALPRLDWPKAIVRSAHWALWTGNNSFLSFSTLTLNAVLVLLLVSLALWTVKGRHGPAEWITAAYCLLFLVALGHQTVVSILYTRGEATGPSPWYSPVILAPLLGLTFLGCSRAAVPGRVLAAGLVALSGYMFLATYAVKLIPLYGGYTGRTSVAALAKLYSTGFSTVANNLDALTLAPAGLVLALAAATSTIVIIQTVKVILGLCHRT